LKPVTKESTTQGQLFENLQELLTPDMVAAALHTTRGTVYQWHSRPRKYGVPIGLFIKHGRKLLIRRETLKMWVLSRCS
jgi:membrane-bound lytic murein transglycosylase MltF